MNPRRSFTAWLIALALLLGQATAFAHALTHLSEREHGLPDKVCEVCVAQAQLGGGLPAASLVLPHTAATSAPPLFPVQPLLSPVRLAASARAPPARSV